MADWPNIAQVSQDLFAQYKQKGQIRTEFENGAVQSRARATSARWVFLLGWKALGQTDYATLCTFFDNNMAGTFNWTHPVTSMVYVVRFSEDQLPEARPAGFVNGEQAWTLSGLQLEQK